MNKFKFTFRIFALAGLFFAFSTIADAQASRTWVSGVGNDADPCSRTAPCKTFSGAQTKTASGGEINCLDPAGFGAITITKNLTIDCRNTHGGDLATFTTGVTLNAAGIKVRLRGLVINGVGNGTRGIRVISSAASLTLEDVVIDGFTSHGVTIETTSGAFKLIVKNTTITNVAGNGINTFLTGAATATISVTDSLIALTGVGFNQGSATNSTIQNSTITNNTTGVQAANATSILAVKNCVISHNTTGVSALVGATIRIGGNMITGNGTGLSGTNIFTWGGNFVDGNTPGGNGTNNGNALIQ